MNPLRYRLVIETGQEQHVSSLAMTRDEVPEALALELDLHSAGGWALGHGSMLRFTKNGKVRWVWVRARTPLDDTL